MKVEVRIGIPKTLVTNDKELEEIKENILDGYMSRISGLVGAKDVSKEDINIVVEKTDGEFYTRISGEDSSSSVPVEPSSTKTLFINKEEAPIDLKEVLENDRDEEEKLDYFDNSDISEDQEKACSEDDDIVYKEELHEECPQCAFCGEFEKEGLSTMRENIALLKLYLMLSDDGGWQELNTEYGRTHINDLEKQFLLKKLFVETGLDSIAKDIDITLNKTR